MKVTVYDAEGKPHVVEPVDAREYIASGSYFAAPPQAVIVVIPPSIDPEPEPGFSMSHTSASSTVTPRKRGRPPKQHPTE